MFQRSVTQKLSFGINILSTRQHKISFHCVLIKEVYHKENLAILIEMEIPQSNAKQLELCQVLNVKYNWVVKFGKLCLSYVSQEPRNYDNKSLYLDHSCRKNMSHNKM